jgi:hypothetical protein
MDRTWIKKELLGVLMESPFYFSIPLARRLELIRYFSKQSLYQAVRENRKQQFNGIFNKTNPEE